MLHYYELVHRFELFQRTIMVDTSWIGAQDQNKTMIHETLELVFLL